MHLKNLNLFYLELLLGPTVQILVGFLAIGTDTLWGHKQSTEKTRSVVFCVTVLLKAKIIVMP